MVSQKPWRPEATLKLAVQILVCILAGAVIVTLLRKTLGDAAVEGSMINAVIGTASFQVGALVLVAFFLRAHQVGWAEAFGFKREPGWALLLGLCVGIVALPCTWFLQSLCVETLARLGYPADEQEAVRLLRETQSVWKQIYLGVFAIGFAPVAEEILFRGILYPLVKQKGFPKTALFGTAVLFALVHANLAVIIPLVFLATLLALLYEWTNNLLACIVVHSLFNAANFVMLFVLKNSGQL
jgi:membrane protease YdiL (CAAX protease family)